MNNYIQVIYVLFGMIFVSSVSFALDNSTTPERESSRCASAHRLRVEGAEIDYNNCLDVGNSFGQCYGEWAEDASESIDEYKRCMGNIEFSNIMSNPTNTMSNNGQDSVFQ